MSQAGGLCGPGADLAVMAFCTTRLRVGGQRAPHSLGWQARAQYRAYAANGTARAPASAHNSLARIVKSACSRDPSDPAPCRRGH